MGNEREVRITGDELEVILKKANLIRTNETLSIARFEPGELVIRIVGE